MSTNLISQVDERPLLQQARTFLKEHPELYKMLLLDCQHDLPMLAALMKTLFRVQGRLSARTPFYLQAVCTRSTAFLMTNLPDTEPPSPEFMPEPSAIRFTPSGQVWHLGRGRDNAVTVRNHFVSRYHATIERGQLDTLEADGFYLTDHDSHNGTFVNYRRLQGRRHYLQDGDLLCLGRQELQFFRVQVQSFERR